MPLLAVRGSVNTVSRLFQNSESIKEKQKNLSIYFNSFFQTNASTVSNDNNNNTMTNLASNASNNSKNTKTTIKLEKNSIKKQLKQIFDINTQGSPKQIEILRKHTHNNIVSNRFAQQNTATRSAVNAAVVLFLLNSDNIIDCFQTHNTDATHFILDMHKFETFLYEYLSTGSITRVTNKIHRRYLNDIVFYPELKTISMGGYSINTFQLEEAKKPQNIQDIAPPQPPTDAMLAKEKIFTDAESGGYINNKYIRKIYNEEQIKAAKQSALDYFTDIIIPKINNIEDNEQKIKTIRTLLLLQQVLDISMRHLVLYKTSYDVLLDNFEPIFKTLEIKKQQERIYFLNNLILINFHRNNGMYAKRILKAPTMLAWLSLPLLSFAGMFMSGFNAKGLGIGATIVIVAAGAAESGGDGLKYGDEVTTLNEKLNCGDKLDSNTRSYNILQEQLIKELTFDIQAKIKKPLLEKSQLVEYLNQGNKDDRLKEVILLNEIITAILDLVNSNPDNQPSEAEIATHIKKSRHMTKMPQQTDSITQQQIEKLEKKNKTLQVTLENQNKKMEELDNRLLNLENKK